VAIIDGEREQGPSWARPGWPVVELDEVNAGLDPTLMTIDTVAAAARVMSSCDGAAATGVAAGLPPFEGLGAGSIWVGSSAAVRSSVVEDGQLACSQLGPWAEPSSPSNQERHDGSTLSGDTL